jgi:hypothetical protein
MGRCWAKEHATWTQHYILSSLQLKPQRAIMTRRSVKTHKKALEETKRTAASGGNLIERDQTWYLEGVTVAGSSTHSIKYALPALPQPLLIQPLPLKSTPPSVSEPEPAPAARDDPPLKKKTQVSLKQ